MALRFALQCELTVGPVRSIVSDGKIVGNNSGLFLARKLIEKYPGIMLLDRDAGGVTECDGFTTGPLRKVDPADTLVVSMDVLESQRLSYGLRWSPRVVPKIANFFWANVSDPDYAAKQDRILLAASAACFPTFANSAKTEGDLVKAMELNLSPRHVRGARLSSAPLGIDVAKVPERVWGEVPERPVVLYPGIYVMGRKRPELWLDVMDSVAAKTPVAGRVRYSDRHADRPIVADMKKRAWLDVQRQDKQQAYYDSLVDVDVVFGTSSDESYGLAFMEAMMAGAVPVFPDVGWAHVLVGKDWPLLFSSRQDAHAMVTWACRDLGAARELMVEHGLTRAELAKTHSIDVFLESLDGFLRQQFPGLEW